MKKKYNFNNIAVGESRTYVIGNDWRSTNNIRAAACDFNKRYGWRLKCSYNSLTERMTVKREY